jgi:homocysteine S-methyltransferase
VTRRIRILDGGMSRELVRLGARLRQPEWSALALMEAPEIVRRVHDDFIAAGAEVITTNSYALVPYHIGEERFRAEGAALIDLAGRLAREAADEAAGRRVLVAGSLPPVFGSYEPARFDPSRVQDYLGVLVGNLAAHVDLWLGETLSLIAEGEAVRMAVAETGKPFWVSFTVADGPGRPEEPSLRSGESVAEAARWAAGAAAEALLFNCSRPEVMEDAVAAARAELDSLGAGIEIGVYANAFEPAPREGGANESLHDIRADLGGEEYCRFARRWAERGATLIGGCCGIGAEHIRQLAAAVGRGDATELRQA